ncbi:MAG: hypothetical protein JXR07_03195 [Reichenbachiella sp.]
MFAVKTDLIKNVIAFHAEGLFSEEEIKKSIQEVKAKTKELKRGFTFIGEISKLEPTTNKGMLEIQKMQAFMIDMGVGRIIRIVENKKTQLQFQEASDNVGYTAMELHSMDEAYEVLDL